MDSQGGAGVLRGNEYHGDDVAAQVEIPDLTEGPRIRVDNLADGSQMDLSIDQVLALYRMATNVANEALELHEAARYAFGHPLGNPAFDGMLAAAPDQTVLFERPCALIAENLAGERIIPLLHWVRPTRRNTTSRTATATTGTSVEGWRLTLRGAESVTVGFAAWNDLSGIASLVESLSDPDTVMLMGGMIDAEPIARLSARASTAALRANRALPAIDLKPVKQILADAGLQSPESTSRYHGSFLRVLTIAVEGGKKIPVAVAIRPTQSHPAYYTTLTTVEEASMDRGAIQAERERRAGAAQQAWRAAAETALNAGGWRSLNLPEPRIGYYYGWNGARTTSVPTLWVTRIDETTWSDIAAAATAAASTLEMQRGASF